MTLPDYTLSGGTHKEKLSNCTIQEKRLSPEFSKVNRAERANSIAQTFIKKYLGVVVGLQSVEKRRLSAELYETSIAGEYRIRITIKTSDSLQQ